jgi:hypothetical protein
MPAGKQYARWTASNVLTFFDDTGSELMAIDFGAGTFSVDGVTVDSGTLAVNGLTASSAELNLLDDAPASVAFTPAAGSSNVSEVTCTVKDAAGIAMTRPVMLDLFLSDSSVGAGLTGTTASGAVAAKAGSQDVATLASKKALRVQTDASGVYVLSITDSAKSAFRVCAQLPGGKVSVSAALSSGDYGA